MNLLSSGVVFITIPFLSYGKILILNSLRIYDLYLPEFKLSKSNVFKPKSGKSNNF